MRYIVTTWHGEHTSVWYVIDTYRNDTIGTLRSIDGHTFNDAITIRDIFNNAEETLRPRKVAS